MLSRSNWNRFVPIAVAGVCALAALPAATTLAREREQPRIELIAYQCAPGMTEATLDSASCNPVAESFDVQIVSIEGSQQNVSLADASRTGNSYAWQVQPTDSDIDSWGIKQSAIPPDTASYLVQGESVYVKQAPLYDYRFTTGVEQPVVPLKMYFFPKATDAVVVPPSQPTSEPAGESSQEQPEPTEIPVVTPTEAPVDNAVQAQPTSLPGSAEGETVTIASGPAPVRIAADSNAVSLAILDAGDDVTVLGDPVTVSGKAWYEALVDTDSTGWIEAYYIDGTPVGSETESVNPPDPDPDELTESKADQLSNPSSDQAADDATLQGDVLFEPGDRAIVVDPPLVLRDAAGLSGGIVTNLYDGQLMTIDSYVGPADGYEWYGVSLIPQSDVSGFVAGGFATKLEFLAGETVAVGAEAVNVRSEPTTSSAITQVAYPDSPAQVVDGPVFGDGYRWYLIEFADGTTGWAVSDYLTLTDSSALAPTAAAIPVGLTMRVVDPPVNLREQPGLSANILDILFVNDEVVILLESVSQDGFDWYLVEAHGITGYVAGDFLGEADVSSESLAAGSQAYVADGPVSLRATPGVEGELLEHLPRSTVVTIVDSPVVSLDGYVWVEVVSDRGALGYVASEFLAPHRP